MISNDAPRTFDPDTDPVSTVTVAEATPSKTRSAQSRHRRLFPVFCGLFVLLLNGLLLTAGPLNVVLRHVNWLSTAVSMTLVLTSIFLGAVLVVQPRVLVGSMDAPSGPDRHYLRWVLVPVVLAIVAVLAVIGAVESWAGYEKRSTPCLELYQQAESIRKDNPKFRMPENSSDEMRCKINQYVLG
jgi:hypothetical protein